jgi:hypothetical protein
MGNEEVNYQALKHALGEFMVPTREPKIAIPMERAMNAGAEVYDVDAATLKNAHGYNKFDWQGYELQFTGCDFAHAELLLAESASGPAICRLRQGESFRSERGFESIWCQSVTPDSQFFTTQPNFSVRLIRDRFARIESRNGPTVLFGRNTGIAIATGVTKDIFGVAELALALKANGLPMMLKLIITQSRYTGIALTDYPLEVYVQYDGKVDCFIPSAYMASSPGIATTVNLPIFDLQSLRVQVKNPNAVMQMLNYYIRIVAGGTQVLDTCVEHQAEQTYLDAFPVINTPYVGFAINGHKSNVNNTTTLIRNADVGGLGVLKRDVMRIIPSRFGNSAVPETVLIAADAVTVAAGTNDTSALSLFGHNQIVRVYWTTLPTVVKKFLASMRTI